MTAFGIYLDEDNQDHDLAATLRGEGLTVRRSASEGMNGKSDAEQLAFASANRLVLYTSNVRDFDRLHVQMLTEGGTHYGLIYRAGRRWSIGEQARRIVRIWRALSAEEMVNRVEFLSQWGEERE